MNSNENPHDVLLNCLKFWANSTGQGDVDIIENIYLNSSSHQSPTIKHLLIGLCGLCCFVGMLFNLILIVALIRYRTQTTPNQITNLFIFSLAISDIFLCTFSMPFQLAYELFDRRIVNGLCPVLLAAFGLPMQVSCLLILLIALNRYRMIVRPFKRQLTRSVACLLIVLIVLASIANSLPVALHVKSKSVSSSFAMCGEEWPNPRLRFAYSVLIFLFTFCIPLTASSTLYLAIYRSLRRKKERFSRSFSTNVTPTTSPPVDLAKFRSSIAATSSSTQGNREVDRKRKRRTTVILIVTMACFTLCWMPWWGLSLMAEHQTLIGNRPGNRTAFLHSDNETSNSLNNTDKLLFEGECKRWMGSIFLFNDSTTSKANQTDDDNIFNGFDESTDKNQIISGKHIRMIDLIVKLIAISSTCINPLLYGWFNEPIRTTVKQRFKCCNGGTDNRYYSTMAARSDAQKTAKPRKVDPEESVQIKTRHVRLDNENEIKIEGKGNESER